MCNFQYLHTQYSVVGFYLIFFSSHFHIFPFHLHSLEAFNDTNQRQLKGILEGIEAGLESKATCFASFLCDSIFFIHLEHKAIPLPHGFARN